MTSIPETLVWCLSTGSTVAVVMAAAMVRQHRRAAVLRNDTTKAGDEHAGLEAHLRSVGKEIRHLSTARLPALEKSLGHPHVIVPGLNDTRLAGSELDKDLSALLDRFTEAVTAERIRVDSAARAVLRGSTTSIQAMSYQMQSLIEHMQYQYDDPSLTQDLLALDHLNEQILRREQVTAVGSGAWPGLTREDSALAEIVVGAKSRIRGYQRVQVQNHITTPVAVVARAVEPVAIALTEILANAVHHSHDSMPVDVGVHTVPNGAVVVVEDAGIGMNADEIRYATELLQEERSMLLTDLGDPPRMGFAATGLLCAQYGFRVSVDLPSAYGGVRAVILIPNALLTAADELRPVPVAVPQPRPPRREPTVQDAIPTRQDAVPTRQDAVPTSTEEMVLPRRRRRDPLPANQPPTSRPPMAAVPDGPTPEETADRMGAFQRGTDEGRTPAESDAPHPRERNDSA